MSTTPQLKFVKPRVKLIKTIDSKTSFTPAQKTYVDTKTIRQSRETKFPRLRHNLFIRDTEDPLADSVTSSDKDTTVDEIDKGLKAVSINESAREI